MSTLVSERVSLIRPKQSGLLPHVRHQKKTRVRFVPNKNSGASVIRVRTLEGTRTMPAGIPLDGRGIRYGDQERADGGFEDFQYIEFEFECEDGMSCASFIRSFRSFPAPCLEHSSITMTIHFYQHTFGTRTGRRLISTPVGITKRTDATEFIAHFKEYVDGWRQRCGPVCRPVHSFRELQRSRRISVSSRTKFQIG